MGFEQKIGPLQRMAERARELQSQGERVVLCHGTFDLLHPGHVRHLRRARQEGDRLFVTITADAYVNKGPNRPVFSHDLRAESLAALGFVDTVAINHEVTAVNVIETVKPDIYVKGNDYRSATDDVTGNIRIEQDAVERHGGRIFYTDEIVFSSTRLLNEHFETFSPVTRSYLKQFKKSHDADTIVEMVHSLKEMSVLVVGETIIDEYCYASPLGQTGKSGNIPSVKYESTERFAGGTLAVANHVSGFAGKITMLSGIGGNCPHADFMREKLHDDVTPVLFEYEEAPTLVKRRFVDPEMNKLFEIYLYERNPVTPPLEEKIVTWIKENADAYDCVIVADYGNGFVTAPMIQALCDSARFLAVNTQINSGNRGYHAITRYPRADFVSLNEPELRLAAHNRHDPLELVAARIGEAVNAQQLAITLGTNGALLLEPNSKTSHRSPALSTHVVDRIGAGDAFLSLTAMALAGKLSPDVVLFLGSAAAALDVAIVCNRETVEPVDLFKYIHTLLK
ncbi:MAG: adenylyltransferase/cytidyltransferase family protein [Magnetococcales bacterium]|nr:adenylyltransferase/cytidyltransferase family protein [Magnetococcales bacterium]